MRSHLRYWLIPLLSAFWLALSTGGALAQQEAHYLMLFSLESKPNLPKNAHTFAAFIQVAERGRGQDQRIQMSTISWLPPSLNLHVLRTRPEVGRNFGLHETLRFGVDQGRVISAWGPYRIQKDLYDRGVAQTARLESGAVAYIVMDRHFRPHAATNCFHAISDIVDGPLLDTGLAYGESVTRLVAAHLAPWFIEPNTTHPGLIESLGLGRYPINYRHLTFTASRPHVGGHR